MEVFLSLILGYAMGCLNPAAWIGKKNHIDLKQAGTGNLGATNTTMVLGRKAGAFVLVFDVAKSFLAARLARWLLPQLAVSGMLASIGVILGHCFPITMHFSGGKGLAAFGGMMLAYNPVVFVIVVLSGIGIMVLLDIGVAAPLLGTVMFPALTFLFSHDVPSTVCAVIASVIILYTHLDNVNKTRAHSDVKVKNYFRDVLFKKKKET
ncbi:MAG: glycerol-3-phosphate acyltransferase [Candidatus Faecousia sp.]|nr:glycerol-3-phosphate acyltransferase [Candidatus Faecousia sp.]